MIDLLKTLWNNWIFSRKVRRYNKLMKRGPWNQVPLIILCLLLSSCTIVPHTVEPQQPSFSDGKQNSSLVSFDATGAVMDAHGRDRYNALIDAYGGYFAPPLKPDEGLIQMGSQWHIDDEHLAKQIQMNIWRHSGRAPVKKGILERVKGAL